MGHFEHALSGDVDAFVAHLDRAIPASSLSTKIESRADHRIGEARMLVRVYERYSALGGNRVSLCVCVLAVGDQMTVSAVSSGGSRAVFWKINTAGETSFLRQAVAVIRGFPS
jgi:CMP-2-keto-3-deoxyoctulosonic acid synthetase